MITFTNTQISILEKNLKYFKQLKDNGTITRMSSVTFDELKTIASEALNYHFNFSCGACVIELIEIIYANYYEYIKRTANKVISGTAGTGNGITADTGNGNTGTTSEGSNAGINAGNNLPATTAAIADSAKPTKAINATTTIPFAQSTGKAKKISSAANTAKQSRRILYKPIKSH